MLSTVNIYPLKRMKSDFKSNFQFRTIRLVCRLPLRSSRKAWPLITIFANSFFFFLRREKGKIITKIVVNSQAFLLDLTLQLRILLYLWFARHIFAFMPKISRSIEKFNVIIFCMPRTYKHFLPCTLKRIYLKNARESGRQNLVGKTINQKNGS